MITLRVKKLRNFMQVAIGLIGSKKANSLLFSTRFGIHTFGLKFPIDVLILDNDNKVVKMSINLMPNKLLVWNPKYKKVLELPSGIINKKRIKLGDTLLLLVK